MRGYNGRLELVDEGILISHPPLRALLCKVRPGKLRIPFSSVRWVRFQPSTGGLGLVGYVQIGTESDGDAGSFRERIRQRNAVTFLRRAEDWQELAHSIARRSGVELNVTPPADSDAVMEDVKAQFGWGDGGSNPSGDPDLARAERRVRRWN